ncbi:hypothetical protein ACFDR9_003619 [Janthinobacterium sp. CG_23.3]
MSIGWFQPGPAPHDARLPLRFAAPAAAGGAAGEAADEADA